MCKIYKEKVNTEFRGVVLRQRVGVSRDGRGRDQTVDVLGFGSGVESR